MTEDVTERRSNRVVLMLSLALLAVALAMGMMALEQGRVGQTQAVLQEQLRDLRADLDDIKKNGSPITDKRLSLLEYKAGVK